MNFNEQKYFGHIIIKHYIYGPITRFRSINGVSVKGLLFINPIPIFINNLKHQSFSTRKHKFFVTKKCDNPIFFYSSKLILTLSSVFFDYWFTISTLQKSKKFLLSFSSLFKSNNWNRWKILTLCFC